MSTKESILVIKLKDGIQGKCVCCCTLNNSNPTSLSLGCRHSGVPAYAGAVQDTGGNGDEEKEAT